MCHGQKVVTENPLRPPGFQSHVVLFHPLGEHDGERLSDDVLAIDTTFVIADGKLLLLALIWQEAFAHYGGI